MPKRIHKIEGISFGTASSNTRYGKKEDSLIVTLPQEAILSGKLPPINSKLRQLS